jgi:hypothetical protein
VAIQNIDRDADHWCHPGVQRPEERQRDAEPDYEFRSASSRTGSKCAPATHSTGVGAFAIVAARS